MEVTKKFSPGATYAARSACDHECVWTFTVVKRTAKFVTLVDKWGEIVRVGVRVWNGIEFCSPLGVYSMSPSLSAERPVAA